MASMECMSSEWFALIYEQLIKRDQFNKTQLYFFELHMSIDDDHGNIFKRELLKLVKTNEERQLMQQGIMLSIQHWLNFYEKISVL